MGENYELIKELVKIGLEPGNILLVKTSKMLSSKQADKLSNYLKRILSLAKGEYIPIAILDGGLDVQVLHIPQRQEVIDHDHNEGGTPKDCEKNQT